ncbi:MAG: hypothetical protein A2V79_01480 [Betaproteobacteria bacterium RBG_16_56_24]|nr:MAG: hypothetical protein A2V79_01480 [Betaproteobacteria bacterium RBG_16_56_24]
MRRVILMMLLAVVSNSALAEWVKVGSNEITTIYVDSATIQRTGNMAMMWHLTDFKTAKKDMGATYMSTKDQNEYDCKEEKLRRRAFSEHSKNMGGGEMVYSDSFTAKWKTVPPDSGIEILWKIACMKK